MALSSGEIEIEAIHGGDLIVAIIWMREVNLVVAHFATELQEYSIKMSPILRTRVALES